MYNKIMFLKIINYAIRIIIIIVGILFICGVFTPYDKSDIPTIIGIICILFGTYRLIIYKIKSKRYEFYSDDESNDIDKKN